MQKFYKTFIGTAATAALAAVLVAGAAQQALAQAAPAAQAEKKPKDAGESDLIQEVNKDIGGTNQQKTLTDLSSWQQKYPESDYRAERLAYFIATYAALNQPDKVLESAGQFLGMDYKTALGPANKVLVLQTLYKAAQVSATLTTFSPSQQTSARSVAKALKALAADDSNKPDALNAAQWTEARNGLNTLATQLDLQVLLAPGSAAMAKKDYAAAEGPFAAAYAEYPESGWVAYNLGAALYAQKDDAKRSKGLFLIARGVAMDPAKGGIADANLKKTLEDFLNKAYRNYHGSDEGLDALKQQASAAVNPPADFKIRTATEIAEEKQKQFEKEYPELAMWMKIKATLTTPEGEQTFESQVKGTGLPKLKGTVVGGKPECRSKELLVALPEPGQTSAMVPEITIKLDTSLKGKPLTGEIVFESAVPSAFSKDPLMLTVDMEQSAIQGLKTEPCTAAAPASKKGAPAGKKGASKKK